MSIYVLTTKKPRCDAVFLLCFWKNNPVVIIFVILNQYNKI